MKKKALLYALYSFLNYTVYAEQTPSTVRPNICEAGDRCRKVIRKTGL